MEKSNVDVFPQADNIDRIFKIINIENEEDLLNGNNMSIILGDITGRQVQYYINASQYLGILDKSKRFTDFGREIRKSNLFEQKIKLAQKIMSFFVFSEVYFTEIILGVKLELQEIIQIMKKHVYFSSEAMYRRRAQTVRSWISWIHSNDELHS